MDTLVNIDKLVCNDLTVVDKNWGQIYVHNRHRADVTTFDASRIVILQHGATYGSTAFSIRLNGLSWMDYLAARGFDVYCLDLPGYGQSEKPSVMNEPAADNPPFMHTADAASCLGSVVDFVCARRQTTKLNLIGWSWGTAITSYYTTHNKDRVERLTLYAPVWDRTNSKPSAIDIDGELGAYRTVSRAATLKRRQRGLPDDLASVVMPPEWFNQWWEATAATDPQGQGESIRAPNGVVADGQRYWNRGEPVYDPSELKIPLLIIVGEWDNDTPPDLANRLFTLCSNVPWKRLIQVSGGTHTVQMERNRLLLFRSVQQFLEEQPPGAEAIE